MKSTWSKAIKLMLHSAAQSQNGCQSAKVHNFSKLFIVNLDLCASLIVYSGVIILDIWK